ncbi:MAG: FAD-dependent oxidoreductase [Bacillota bacterium]
MNPGKSKPPARGFNHTHLKDRYDVIIIGGGITGAGVARDCAMRGISTLLLERRDFASGTTGTCMGLLHGGPRYLMTNPELTRISCQESGYVQKIAPHLCFSVPFLFLVHDPGQMDPLNKFFSIYDQYQHLKNGKPHVSLSREDILKIEPSLEAGFAGGITSDEWGVNVFRLNLLTVKSAFLYGAAVRNHTEVTGILKENGAVTGVEIKEAAGGETRRINARYVVNASGPWAPRVAAMAGAHFKLRPSRGVHLILDRRITSVGLAVRAIDGRTIELLPHENTTMIGCTDSDFFSSPDDARVYPEDIEYLVRAVEEVMPQVRRARVIRAMAGVRPLLYEAGMPVEKVTRDHRIKDHAEEGIPGFITVGGGKMVTHRLMAQEVTDLLCAGLGIDRPCRTHTEPLPGGERLPTREEIENMAQKHRVHTHTVARMAARHGSLTGGILEKYCRGPGALELCHCEPVLTGEARHAVTEEWARTPDDIRRRTRTGMGPCQGTRCAWKAAVLLAEDLGLPPREAGLHRGSFLQERWKGKMPVLDGDQLRQEELSRCLNFFGEGGGCSRKGGPAN